jgi:hypothetical protein
MNSTIECNFGVACADDGNLTRPFLKKISFIRPDSLSTLDRILIEFADVPESIQRICSDKEAQGCKPPFFTIDSISECGVVLSDAGRDATSNAGFRSIYIPLNRIACLHTFSSSCNE